MEPMILLGAIKSIAAILFVWCLFTEFLIWAKIIERQK